MHTIKVIAGGLALLAGFLAAPAVFGPGGRARAALVFIPIWLVAALVNLWTGVSRAGYPLSVEAPIFLVVFGVPALVALVAWRYLTRA